MKKDKALNVAIICSLLAIGVHSYLSMHYYDLKLGGGGGNAICNVNSYFSCDTATASKYASLFGVPIAIWGLFTNLITLLFFAFSRFNLSQDNERTARYGFVVSAVVLVTSVIMGSISVVQINSLCLFCAGAYVLSAIQFFAAWKSTPVSMALITKDIKSVFSSQKWVLGMLIAIPALSFLVNAMTLDSHGYGNIKKLTEEKVAYWNISPVQTFDNNGLTFQKGSSEPVMTIVEFADYRCHHCADAYPALHAFTSSHPDVRLVFKAFPLDGTCNSAITGGDGVSCALALLSMCSEKQNQKGWQAHHFIFDNQKDFQNLNLESAADRICKETGTNCDELKKCAKSDEALAEVKAMAAEGEKAKISGTPSIFVNSKLLLNGQLLPVLDATYQKIKSQ